MTVAYLSQPDRPRLAWQHTQGRANAPGILFLPGYASDMAGSKATALFEWARAAGRSCTLFDYAGCGESDGVFAAETLHSWLGDALAILDDCTRGPQLVIGSSMGGWLMLHLALARPERVAGLIGIAAAPDFTEWDFDAARRATLERDGQLLEPNPYGPEPTLFTQALWHSGQAMRLLEDEIAIACPVTLLHGQADDDVPWSLALRLAEQLRSAEVEVTLVKDGDHRLSRPQDIALLIAAVDRMMHRITAP